MQKLQQIRKELKLSQEEISSQIGISYRAYTSYERGDRKPSIEFLEKLVEKFNVNLNWLIADVGEMFNTPKYEDVKDEFEKRVEEILKKKGVLK